MKCEVLALHEVPQLKLRSESHLRSFFVLQAASARTSPRTRCWPSTGPTCCTCPPPTGSTARATASRWARPGRGWPARVAGREGLCVAVAGAKRGAKSVAQPWQEIGAKTIDLEWVQVHPTGLVKPDDADAKIKFLAAEARPCPAQGTSRDPGPRSVPSTRARACLAPGPARRGRHHPERRGRALLQRAGPPRPHQVASRPRCGPDSALALLCGGSGPGRDYVTGEMWKSKPPFRPARLHLLLQLLLTTPCAIPASPLCDVLACRLCLNQAASDEIIWHCKPGA